MSKLNYEGMVGDVHNTNHWGELKITAYMGKKGAKHLFTVEFLNTGHTEELIGWDSIRKGSVTDTKARKIKTASNKRAKFFERRKKMKEEARESYTPENLVGARFLSVDLATESVGIALWDNCVLKNYKSISAPKSMGWEGRGDLIANEIRDTAVRSGVSLVVVEGIYLGENVRTFEQLAVTRGYMQSKLRDVNIRTHVVPVSFWKSRMGLSGKREEQKSMSIKLALEFLNEPVQINDDIADAINLGRAVL